MQWKRIHAKIDKNICALTGMSWGKGKALGWFGDKNYRGTGKNRD